MNHVYFLLLTTLLFWLLHLVGAALVQFRNVRVNYTRKLIHFSLFAIHFFGNRIFPYEVSLETKVVNAGVALLALLVFIEPLQAKSPLLGFAFKAVDRPEDRPFTLQWLLLQLILMYLVLIPLSELFASFNRGDLLWIPLLISGLGDGLAEPVGVRFGRHKYQTFALFTRRKYTRSLEGSACVFLSGVLAAFIFKDQFTSAQFWVLVPMVSIGATLIEAKSPHTLDQPFIVGGVGLMTYFVYVYM